MENISTVTAEETLRRFMGPHWGATSGSPHLTRDGRDRAMKWACRAGCIAVIDAVLRRGASLSAVPVASVAAKSKPVAVVDSKSISNGANRSTAATGGTVIVKALTLQLTAKYGQVETFAHLISLGTRLDEPGTSLASIRSLIELVTRGPDAPALLRLFFRSAHLARQLGQEMRNEALMGLLQGCAVPRPSQAPSLDEYLEFARALLDAGADPNAFRGSSLRSTSPLSAALPTLFPDLIRLLLYRGACADGPSDLQPPPVPRWPLHVPLRAAAHALATSLLDPTAQVALRHIVNLLLERGADINICVPYLQPDGCGSGSQALDALKFLLSHGANPGGPPRHPVFDSPNCFVTHRALLRSGHYRLGQPRVDAVRGMMGDWGVGGLASAGFVSALELLAGHPSRRGGVRVVAEALAKYDYTVSPSLSSTSSRDDAILGAWKSVVTSIVRLLAPHELGEFLHAYVVRKGTCPDYRPGFGSNNHLAGGHVIGGLTEATVAVLLVAGADVNHRHRTPGEEQGDGDGPTVLHAICIWLAGRASEENSTSCGWRRSCLGFRHTPHRAQFIRFLVETCGANTGARYQGRAPAEILVQLRRPELDAEESVDLGWSWGREAGVVREARQAFVALLENGSN